MIQEFESNMRRACFMEGCKEEDRRGKTLCSLLAIAKQETPDTDETTKRCISLMIKGLRRDIPDCLGLQPIAIEVIRKFPYLFQFLPKEMQTQSMCEEVIEQAPEMIEYVAPKHLTYDLCLQSVKKRWLSVAAVPMGMRTDEICEIAAGGDEAAKMFFPPSVLKS